MKPEWQIAWLQSPKILAFTEAIARKYVHLRAQAVEKTESRVLRSLFCKFKTLVSFPEAAAFAWLDQADLGLSRRPRPSPLDGSSASHATCSTRGAAPRRTARVPGESTQSPGGSGLRWAARITQNNWTTKTFSHRTSLILSLLLSLMPYFRVAVLVVKCVCRYSTTRLLSAKKAIIINNNK